jgi:hypothetical protein
MLLAYWRKLLAALSSVGDESAMKLRRGASFFYGITMLLQPESELLRIHNSRTSENSVKAKFTEFHF